MKQCYDFVFNNSNDFSDEEKDLEKISIKEKISDYEIDLSKYKFMKSTCYIDGSVLDNKKRKYIGYACYFGENDERNFIGNNENGTNNRAELLALCSCLSRNSGDIDIYCDSSYTILMFNKIRQNIKKGTIKNRDILYNLKDLIRNYDGKISIHKVKSHSGIEGNEIVDKMAKLGALKSKEC